MKARLNDGQIPRLYLVPWYAPTPYISSQVSHFESIPIFKVPPMRGHLT